MREQKFPSFKRGMSNTIQSKVAQLDPYFDIALRCRQFAAAPLRRTATRRGSRIPTAVGEQQYIHYFTSFQSSVRKGTAGMPNTFFRLQGM